MGGLEMKRLHNITLHKCECCGRVRDIPFRLYVMDAETGLVAGELDFCNECGQNFCKLTNLPMPAEVVLKEFHFAD